MARPIKQNQLAETIAYTYLDFLIVSTTTLEIEFNFSFVHGSHWP